MTEVNSNYAFQGTTRRSAPGGTSKSVTERLRALGRFILFKEAGPTKAWYGVLFLGGVTTWLGVVGYRVLASEGSVAAALSSARGRTVGPALIVFIAVILIAERIWPAVPRPVFSRAQLVDATYLAIFAIVVLPLLTLVETGFAQEISQHASFLVLGRLSLGPQVIVSGLILIGIDAMNWGAHVANHRSLTLWRLHALHHSQEDLTVLTTFRTHPLVHASYLPSLFPALILGASGTVPAVAIVAYSCLVTLPHANLRWTFGPLGRVFVSPAYHRLHHAASFIDDRGTVNFGFVLVGWDQLIHRAAFPTGTPVATGIYERPVPVEQSGSIYATPKVMLAQLVQPFLVHSKTDG
jgi:sterol desaturase/sphingolipid hydroxylase (fatty acid hydroxylase superfamily)